MKKKIKRTDFDLEHHGDEFIFTMNDDETLTVDVSVQTSMDSSMHTKLTFPSQSQARLYLPIILPVLIKRR